MKTIFITGASSDIGVNLIKAIHSNYDCILAHYNSNVSTLSQLKEELGDKIMPVQADFGDRDSAISMVQQVLDSQKFPDHIVHLSASQTKNKPFLMWNGQDFDHDFTIGVTSVIEILKAFIPNMVSNNYGKIVFMLSSFVAGVSPKYQSPYIVSKFALLGLMKNLAAEFSSKGIRVNGISPDMIDTKFNNRIARKIKEINAENSPIGRNLNVDDVIPTITFLLSDGADTISGINLPVTTGIELK